MDLGTAWVQARDAFYKKTGINKKLPAILGKRAAASLNRRPLPQATTSAAQATQATTSAAQATAPKNNNMIYLGVAALLALKFLL